MIEMENIDKSRNLLYNSNMSGKIEISKLNVPPEKHELETARYFATRGYDIEFIPPSNIPEVHRPDILMLGIEWEIKCPIGKGRNTISRNIKQAVKQSENIIIDLRRIALPEKQCIIQIEKQVHERRSIKRILVIKKDQELLDITTQGIKVLIDK